MVATKFLVNTKPPKQNSRIVYQTLLVMDFISDLSASTIGKMLGEDACICYREGGHDAFRFIRQAEKISFPKQLFLIFPSIITEEIIDVITTAIKKLDVQILFTELNEIQF